MSNLLFYLKNNIVRLGEFFVKKKMWKKWFTCLENLCLFHKIELNYVAEGRKLSLFEK